MSCCALMAPLDHVQSGLALSVRNLGTMGVILYATTLVSRMGAATLAAHEIMRQVFIFSIQLFSALDVTAQSLVGLHLGKVGAHTCTCDSTLKRLSIGIIILACRLALIAVDLCDSSRLPLPLAEAARADPCICFVTVLRLNQCL